MTDPPELDAALRQRDAAEAQLAKQYHWMCERYGHRGVPAGAPEQRENDRLQRVVWDAHQKVREVTEKLKEQDRWDTQIERNRNRAASDMTARIAENLGMKQTARDIRDRAELLARIADHMDACPNNPRNGGDGSDRGDGKWVDRRPRGWACAEFELGLERSGALDQPDPIVDVSAASGREVEHEREAGPDRRIAGVDPLTREDVERER